MQTEDPKEWSGQNEEVAPSSFNGWLYQRLNAESVKEWLVKWAISVGDLEGIDENGRLVIQTVAKAFDKTFGEMIYDEKDRKDAAEEGKRVYEPFTVANMNNRELRGKINPRAIWIFGMVVQRHPKGLKDLPGDDKSRIMPYDANSGESTLSLFDVTSIHLRQVNIKTKKESVFYLMDLCVGNGLISVQESDEILNCVRLGGVDKIAG